jgi:AGZA family xanthine/uracil permease-like MFS transporter
LWAALLAHLVDRRLLAAAACGLIAAVLSLFGVIHSPFPGGRMFVPWGDLDLPVTAAGQTPMHFAAGYAVVALILAGWAVINRCSTVSADSSTEPGSDHPDERHDDDDAHHV